MCKSTNLCFQEHSTVGCDDLRSEPLLDLQATPLAQVQANTPIEQHITDLPHEAWGVCEDESGSLVAQSITGLSSELQLYHLTIYSMCTSSRHNDGRGIGTKISRGRK